MKLHRKTAIKILLASAIPLLAAGIPYAAFNSYSKGTSGAQFLKLGVGARALGMGEAYSAVADDGSAIYWNPGAILNTKGASISVMQASLFGDINDQFLGYATPVGDNSAFGVGVQRLTAGTIKETDSSGVETGASSSPSDIAGSLGYAHKAGGWSIGAAAKYISSKISDSATAFAADFGLLSPKLLNDKFRLSLVAQNIGSKIKFDTAGDALPLNVKIGSALNFNNKFIAALDLNFPNDNAPYAAAGCEYRINPEGRWQFAGRAGYNTRASGDIKGLSGISLGLGVVISQLSIDYAFIPYGDLGNTQRISLGIGFGGSESSKQRTSSEPAEQPEPKIHPETPKAQNTAAQGNITQLLKDLQDESWETRKEAAFELGKTHDLQAVDPLIEKLNDENEQVSGMAARALGQIGDARAVQPLIEALGDASAYVRASAAKGLGNLGDKHAIAPLKKVLRDEDASVKKAASNALRNLGNK